MRISNNHTEAIAFKGRFKIYNPDESNLYENIKTYAEEANQRANTTIIKYTKSDKIADVFINSDSPKTNTNEDADFAAFLHSKGVNDYEFWKKFNVSKYFSK